MRCRLLLPLLALLVAVPGCVTIDLMARRGELQETVVYGSSGPKVLMLEVEGLITEAEEEAVFGPGRESTVARVREQLDRARRDGGIEALLLRIDTPGGTVTASDIVYREILLYKQEHGLPVVAHLMGTATSGGYYVAMAADEIAAQPTTITGSIGVIFVGLNVSGLMEKLGIEDQTLTGGEHKDAGSPLRSLSPEERQHLQSVIDDLHGRFRLVVADGRPQLAWEEVLRLSDGSIYSATQALDHGLVDRLSTMGETVDAIASRLGAEQVQVVSYHRPREWRRNVYTEAPAGPPTTLRLDLGSLWGPFQKPGFHYLWAPGLR